MAEHVQIHKMARDSLDEKHNSQTSQQQRRMLRHTSIRRTRRSQSIHELDYKGSKY